jgi:hypothetical protein
MKATVFHEARQGENGKQLFLCISSPSVRWGDRGPNLDDVTRVEEARWNVERPVEMAGKSEADIRDHIRNLIVEMAGESGLELEPNETLKRLGV